MLFIRAVIIMAQESITKKSKIASMGL